jgi:hypothetical protein
MTEIPAYTGIQERFPGHAKVLGPGLHRGDEKQTTIFQDYPLSPSKRQFP